VLEFLDLAIPAFLFAFFAKGATVTSRRPVSVLDGGIRLDASNTQTIALGTNIGSTACRGWHISVDERMMQRFMESGEQPARRSDFDQL